MTLTKAVRSKPEISPRYPLPEMNMADDAASCQSRFAATEPNIARVGAKTDILRGLLQEIFAEMDILGESLHPMLAGLYLDMAEALDIPRSGVPLENRIPDDQK